MTIRELHGIAAKAAMGRYVQTIYVIDGGEPATVVVAIQGEQVAITAEEARFLADLLMEAAARVHPLPMPEDHAALELKEAPDAESPEPPPPLIAVRNPKPPKVWTPERNELMRVEVPLGRLTREELKAALEALPGPPIPNLGRLGTQAHTLGLTWGTPMEAVPEPQEALQESVPDEAVEAEEFVDQPEEEPAQPVAPGVAAVPADVKLIPRMPHVPFSREAMPTTRAMEFEQVKDLAARWGVPFSSWEDLPRVNNKAESLGASRIERKYDPPRKLHNLDAG